MAGPELIPARTRDDAHRLTRLLLDDPAVAGRLQDPRLGDLKESYSGAFMLEGAWTERPQGATAEGVPVIVKVGATPREVRWMRDLARVDPGLIPTLYASGDAVGEEPLAWMVMERCRYVVGWQWGGAGYGMLLEAGVRFQLASRAIAPPVGPSDVPAAWFCGLVRGGVACDPPAPGPAEAVLERLERDWAWVLANCRVELCHGDLHPGNAVSRAAPPHPEARALLIDHAPHAMPWVTEPAYCEVLYWRTPTPHGEPTLVHAMAAVRARRGLEVPPPEDLDRLATLFLAWHALRLWPHARHRHHHPDYAGAARRYIEAAATL